MYVSCQARLNEFYSMKLLQSLSNIITILLVYRYVVTNSYNFWKKLIFGHTYNKDDEKYNVLEIFDLSYIEEHLLLYSMRKPLHTFRGF